MITQWERQAEVNACYELSSLIHHCLLTGERNLKRRLRHLWDNESWESIVEKFQTEGSVWYVWWQDGVRMYMKRRARWTCA